MLWFVSLEYALDPRLVMNNTVIELVTRTFVKLENDYTRNARGSMSKQLKHNIYGSSEECNRLDKSQHLANITFIKHENDYTMNAHCPLSN